MSKNNTNAKVVAISTVDATNVTCSAPAGTLLKSTGAQVSTLGTQGTAGQALISNGPSADPSWSSLTTLGTNVNVGGTNGQILLSDGANIKRLTTQGTTGQTLISNGAGADPSWTTQTTALTNVTSAGLTNRVIYSDGTTLQALAAGTSGYVLTSNGGVGAPSWTQNKIPVANITVTGGTEFLYVNPASAGATQLAILLPSSGYIYYNGSTHQYNQYIDSTVNVQNTAAGTGALGVFTGANKNLTALGQGTSGDILTSNGTGSTPSWTASLALAKISTAAPNGSLAYSDGTKLSTLGQGTSNQLLTSNGAGNAPTWSNLSASSISLTGTAGTLVKTNGTNPGLLTSQGTVGQSLLSQGAGADPTWGTPTVPLTSVTGGSNGNVVYSNGTNATALANPGSYAFLTYTGTTLAWTSTIPPSICTQPSFYQYTHNSYVTAYTDYTLTIPNNVLYAKLLVQAGGGAGGNITANGLNFAAGGGGGAGGWAEMILKRSAWELVGGVLDNLRIRVGRGSQGSGANSSFASFYTSGNLFIQAFEGNDAPAVVNTYGGNGTGGSVSFSADYSDFSPGAENGFDASDIMGWTGGRGGGTPRGRGGGERPYNLRGWGAGYDAVGYGSGGGGAIGVGYMVNQGGKGGHGFASVTLYYQ